jgi:hypothetical protein
MFLAKTDWNLQLGEEGWASPDARPSKIGSKARIKSIPQISTFYSANFSRSLGRF